MPADRLDPKIETIVAEALRKTDPAERVAFLDQTCEHDFVLRQSVEKRIEDSARASGSPENETTGLDPDATEDVAADGGGQGTAGPIPSDRVIAGLGTHIGRYRLVEKIGEGGMGIVYRGMQEESAGIGYREVAAPRSSNQGWIPDQVIARFEAG